MIIPRTSSVKFEDILRVHWRIDKAIHGVKIRLDDQGIRKPLVAGSNPVAAGFYIRGPESKGWCFCSSECPLEA